MRPFTIAMRPLDPAHWLELDDRRDADLAEKVAIFRAEPGAAQAEPGTEDAQADVADRIAAALIAAGHGLGRAGTPLPVAARVARLADAALMLQDDLVIMRRGADGWRLAAAALAFPSSWSLDEKFGRPMDAIHTTVPGWAGPMATRVGRIFDNLAPNRPVWRLNWSIQMGGGLRLAHSKGERAPFDPSATPLVRVERQTLLKLTGGDLLFTIKVMVDPVDAFAAHPDGEALAAGLAQQLAGLDADQLAYKGLGPVRAALLERLAALAG